MKSGLTGDTHGRKQAIRKILHLAPPVEMWLHTGDFSQDSRYIAEETGLPVVAVAGNTDPKENISNFDEYIDFEGKRIWLTHGNRYLHGNSTQELAWWGHKLEMDIIIFGHTHVPLVKWIGDLLLINPGSPTYPRGEEGPTFGDRKSVV